LTPNRNPTNKGENAEKTPSKKGVGQGGHAVDHTLGGFYPAPKKKKLNLNPLKPQQQKEDEEVKKEKERAEKPRMETTTTATSPKENKAKPKEEQKATTKMAGGSTSVAKKQPDKPISVSEKAIFCDGFFFVERKLSVEKRFIFVERNLVNK
jgi:hypothetical protein